MIRLRLEQKHLRALFRGEMVTIAGRRWPAAEDEDVQIILADIGYQLVLDELMKAIADLRGGEL